MAMVYFSVIFVANKSHLVLVTLIVLFLSSCHGDTRTSSSTMNNQPNPGLTLIGRWRQVGPASDESTSTKFYFEPSGILVLDYQGEKTRFSREP